MRVRAPGRLALSIVSVGVSNSNSADRSIGVGHAKAGSDRVLVFELTKEARTEIKLRNSEQNVLYGRSPVNPPVRHTPLLKALSEARGGFVGFGVALYVRCWAHVRNE